MRKNYFLHALYQNLVYLEHFTPTMLFFFFNNNKKTAVQNIWLFLDVQRFSGILLQEGSKKGTNFLQTQEN